MKTIFLHPAAAITQNSVFNTTFAADTNLLPESGPFLLTPTTPERDWEN